MVPSFLFTYQSFFVRLHHSCLPMAPHVLFGDFNFRLDNKRVVEVWYHLYIVYIAAAVYTVQHKMFYVLSTRPRERFSEKYRKTNQRVPMGTRGLIIVEIKADNELAVSLYWYILRLSKNENML